MEMAETDTRRAELRLDLEGMTCASCAARIERRLNTLDGVEATVNFATEQATVHCDAPVSVEELVGAVESAGYHVCPAAPAHSPGGMVRLSFLLESSFIALTTIVVGTGLGLILAYNVIADSAEQASWDSLAFSVPWLNLAVIFFVVYLVALATTLVPSIRASRVYPAEALRYQ